MNAIVGKDSLSFKDIEKEIYRYVCQIAVKITKELLTACDKSTAIHRQGFNIAKDIAKCYSMCYILKVEG